MPLPSLPKDQIAEFLEGLLPDTKLLIQPKIDGCAVAIKYENGKLEKAISNLGYEANGTKANQKAYDELYPCCKIGGMDKK